MFSPTDWLVFAAWAYSSLQGFALYTPLKTAESQSQPDKDKVVINLKKECECKSVVVKAGSEKCSADKMQINYS